MSLKYFRIPQRVYQDSPVCRDLAMSAEEHPFKVNDMLIATGPSDRRDPPLPLTKRKRAQVAAACFQCQKKKIKVQYEAAIVHMARILICVLHSAMLNAPVHRVRVKDWNASMTPTMARHTTRLSSESTTICLGSATCTRSFLRCSQAVTSEYRQI